MITQIQNIHGNTAARRVLLRPWLLLVLTLQLYGAPAQLSELREIAYAETAGQPTGKRLVVVGDQVDLTAENFQALYEPESAIRELIIEAHEVRVHGRVKVPGGSISIGAETLRFMDETAGFSVKAPAHNPPTATEKEGLDGRSAGSITLSIKKIVEVVPVKEGQFRFNLAGGRGQHAMPGRDGVAAGPRDAVRGGRPGRGGSGGVLKGTAEIVDLVNSGAITVNFSAGPPGKSDVIRNGAPKTTRWKRRMLGRIRLDLYEIDVKAGKGADPLPPLKGGGDSGKWELSQQGPHPEALELMKRFLVKLRPQGPESAAKLARYWYERTSDWQIPDTEGKTPILSSTQETARKTFRDEIR